MKLAGKRVAFTGRLASMTRPEAADLVRAHGGTFITSVTRTTSFLVIGQEGWPLRKDGGLAAKLEIAKQLQIAGHEIGILTEEELLQRLGLEDAGSGIHKRFTLAQLGRLLKIPRDRLRAWMRAGLVDPVENVQGVCYFDFQQVTGVRTLWELARAGVSTGTIRRSLEQLTAWKPSLEASLAQLRLLEQDGQLLMRLDDGQLVEPSGQLHFDFDSRDDEAVTTAPPMAADAEEKWRHGCALEEAGELAMAAKAYREALLAGGPAATICYNLANVLYRLGELGQAAERYRQTVELDRACIEAWNNLGNVLVELGQPDAAIASYRQALAIQPAYADAHYNLAEVLEQRERFSEARRHWKEYLRHEQVGAWADYARRRLAN
jgi:tetratricopeptide (TPR) repeat protein